MDTITTEDIQLVNRLCSRYYTGNTMSSNSTESERSHFKKVKEKLKSIAEYFANRYESKGGPFTVSVSPEHNPITRGTTCHNVWSCIFKGAENKQYAAQISFVVDRDLEHVNLGFYFGRASSRTLTDSRKKEYEERLRVLGRSLADFLTNDEATRSACNSLLDLGFVPYSDGSIVTLDDWIEIIRENPARSQITVRVRPNELGVIDNSVLDYYIAEVIFLMDALTAENRSPQSRHIQPLTPQQSAKRAERLAEIGNKGELYVLGLEKTRLNSLGFDTSDYPKHVALESTTYGYDICSLDEDKKEIFIEVKTTTRTRTDIKSRRFNLSSNEYRIFQKEGERYRLFRVYNVENEPSYEVLDLKEVNREPDGYLCNY